MDIICLCSTDRDMDTEPYGHNNLENLKNVDYEYG